VHMLRPMLTITTLLGLVTATVPAQEMVFPADGVTDITKPPYAATPNDSTDDTAAFQQALKDRRRLIYVPDGTYLISDTLRWGHRQTRQILQGQSESGTILKLIDNAPGYQDPRAPKAVIWTGETPAQRFRNGIRNLTVDTGTGNPGATGIQFIANNQGGMTDVTIRSGDGAGVVGLDLGYTTEQGPCLIKGITVRGFDTGIFMKYAVDGVVLEDIDLQRQRKVGVFNDGQSVSFRGLRSRNSVIAYHNGRHSSLTALIDSELTAPEGVGDMPAILNESGMFVRNVRTSGYPYAIKNKAGHGTGDPGPMVDEFVSHAVLSLFPSPQRSLNLPIQEPPPVSWQDPAEWVSVTNFQPQKRTLTDKDGKAVEVTDWSPALQQAIDSGARTVYFPVGTYGLYSDVHVRGNVERIIGMENEFRPRVGPTGPTFFIEDGPGPVVIERADLIYTALHVVQRSQRPVILRSLAVHEMVVEQGAAPMFIEDVVGGFLHLHPGTQVWARQLNLEKWEYRDAGPQALNEGGQLWVLGIKTEYDPDVIITRKGGSTEVIGGFIYANKAYRTTAEKTWFVIEDAARVSFTVGEWVGRKQPFTPVIETRNGETRRLEYGDAHPRGQGSMAPLFVGYPADPKPTGQR
jgi:hypothetical protein